MANFNMNDKFEKKTNISSKVIKDIEIGTTHAGVQSEPDPEEVATRKSEMRTQGRKNCELSRINMAFTPENYDFIRVMSKSTGKSMTQCVNLMLSEYRDNHMDFFTEANELLKKYDL